MTLLAAIEARHSVRKYLDKEISADSIVALQDKIEECNKAGNLNIQLVPNPYCPMAKNTTVDVAKNQIVNSMESTGIVSAKLEDAGRIAWIVAQGMHMNEVPPFLKPMAERDNTLYSWKNARLLKVDGLFAGGLVSYDGGWHEEGRRNTWVIDGKLLNSGDVPETTDGEYYLDSLAIMPDFRGHGLWRLLFDDAVEIARGKGFHRVTLICDEEYPKLGKLYSSYGFVPGDTFQYFGTLCRKMSLKV